MTDVSKHYFGDTGRAYAERKQLDPHAIGYRLNAEYFRPYLSKDDCLLDFGCGNGGMLLALAESVRDARGLEVNPIARQIAAEQGLKVYASLQEIPSSPTFDVVTSNHVLEHVRDPSGTLERIRVAMKPGGRIVLKLPVDSIHDKEQRLWSRGELNHHLHTWTPRSIANTLFEAGFEVERSDVITSCWHPRLFGLRKIGLDRFAFWAMAIWKDRRQLFVVGRVPATN